MSRKQAPPGQQGKLDQPNAGTSGQTIDFDVFAAGNAPGEPILNAFGGAQGSVAIDLQGMLPPDRVAIANSISDAVDLRAWGKEPVSGTATATADEQGSVSIVDGKVTGDLRTIVTIDVSATLPASHVAVHLHVSDVFDLGLSGAGYVGAALTTASASTSLVPIDAGDTSSFGGDGGTFDLAKFAAAVLGTTRWNIAFTGFSPGESLHVQGHSTRTVEATADLLRSANEDGKPEHLVFHDTDRTNFSFNEHAGSLMSAHDGPHDLNPIAVDVHENVQGVG